MKNPRTREYQPDWSFESRFAGPVCGVDEAGRGPLAGPVVAAAVILDPADFPDGLNDSKKLTAKRRDILFDRIYAAADVGVGIAEPEEIDRINILGASLTAMQRAVSNLSAMPDAALIDGNKKPALNIPCETIVKGDSRSLSIAAASIIAKVTRDRLMQIANRRFPGYEFDRHKGYPTQSHRDRVLAVGPCPIHRHSYAPVRMASLKHKLFVDINQA